MGINSDAYVVILKVDHVSHLDSVGLQNLDSSSMKSLHPDFKATYSISMPILSDDIMQPTMLVLYVLVSSQKQNVQTFNFL